MTADIFAQFREVPDPEVRTSNAGVYLLLDGDEVVYVGASSDVPERVYFHSCRVEHPSGKQFDRALWMRLPPAVLHHYEGALIRGFKPKYNLTCPADVEHDAEILDGLGLGHLTTDGWRDHFRAVRARERQREAEQRERAAARFGGDHA